MHDSAKHIETERSDCNDICLIAKFLDGSEAAFGDLFYKYQDRLFSLCKRFLGNHTEAEDAVMDAFMDIHHGLKHFRGESTFRTWAYRITVRTCMNRMRKMKRRNEQCGDWVETPSTIGHPDIERIILQETMSKLPDHYLMVLVLKYFEQLSIEEIATALDCGTDQVKMRLHRARNTLKDLLSQTTGGNKNEMP